MKTIKIKVPATTANLGSGFDVFGAALNLYNEIEVTEIREQRMENKERRVRVKINIIGEGKDTLPRDEKNIVWKAMKKVFEICKAPLGVYHLRLVNNIPLASGLGSSASAILGGLLIANKICYNRLSDGEILRLAVKAEGHPDNIIPAFAGGFCICYGGGSIIQTGFRKYNMPSDLTAVVCVPEFEFETKFARGLLPKNVSLKSAVFNISRAALFVAAILGRDYRLLPIAMEDELHQKYRGKYIPGIAKVFEAAKSEGAYGAAISGSGPAILAICPRRAAARVGIIMRKTFSKHRINSKFFACNFNNSKTKVLSL